MPTDLDPVPAAKTANFEYLVRTALNQWELQIEANANEIEAARKGELDLETLLDAIIAGTKITDGVITEPKLDVLDSPGDGEALSWNAGAGKFEWVPFGAATDTKQVKMDAADSEGYLETKIDDVTIKVDGSKNLYVVDGSTTVKGAVSVNTLDFTASSGVISRKQNSRLTKTQADSPYTVLAADLRGDVTHDNTGASGECIFLLPAANDAHIFLLEIEASQYCRPTANGSETIRLGTDVTAAGGYIRCAKAGARLLLAGNTGVGWTVREITEYWRKDI